MTVPGTAPTLAGRRALVTGGASGIGAACARELAARGAHVTVADVDPDGAQRLADELGGEAWGVDRADTRARDHRARAVDVHVHNAGGPRGSPPEDVRP
ncbi:SDR family NAD(P)-dependent oxidoreductase, partial [Cellulosimicrobium funkei]|uniref:SDR family NAD(P)-dependent oxidoreductase n=1 Tax=Cellulosimicrobium funkei TaxID=264251 RepID=UPI0030F5872D